jgi:hypothetical protein
MSSCDLNKIMLDHMTSSLRYFHLDLVEGLACPGNPESYAGGRLTTGRVSQARQVNMGRDQTKRNTLVL